MLRQLAYYLSIKTHFHRKSTKYKNSDIVIQTEKEFISSEINYSKNKMKAKNEYFALISVVKSMNATHFYHKYATNKQMQIEMFIQGFGTLVFCLFLMACELWISIYQMELFIF